MAQKKQDSVNWDYSLEQLPWIYNNSDYPNLVQIVFTGFLKTIGMDLLKLQDFLDGQNKHYFQGPENGFNPNQEAYCIMESFLKTYRFFPKNCCHFQKFV